jgi:hypothetical protein
MAGMPDGKFLAPQLHSDHAPQSEARPHPEVGLHKSQVEDEEAPGDEDQKGVVKHIVGNEQHEERRQRGRTASEQIPPQTEMLDSDGEVIDSRGGEHRAQNDHDEHKAQLAPRPLSGTLQDPLYRIHYRQPFAESIDS